MPFVISANTGLLFTFTSALIKQIKQEQAFINKKKNEILIIKKIVYDIVVAL